MAAAGKDASRTLANLKTGGVDLFTKDQFGDCTVEVEVMIPKGSNSGVYLLGEYEVLVFDSYGMEKPGTGDMGAVYGAAAPFVIEFVAPKFDGDRKTADARFVKVTLNGRTIHENVEVKRLTPAG